MKNIDRREFLSANIGLAAAAAIADSPSEVIAKKLEVRDGAKMRLALVGTGIRGCTMWGKSIVEEYSDLVEFVGLCDINPGRLAFAKSYIGTECPTFENFDEMLQKARPDVVVVTTVDSTHHEFIVKAMEAGCDVISEKPMTTDETRCQAILDAQRRTKKDLIVTFNYRYSPHRQRMKEILMSGRIGELSSVDFHWYLDIYHGASYFRRWHGKEAFGGTLWVHKATHHFDLLNWWIESEPSEVYASAALEHYGFNGPFRASNCRPCPHKSECQFYWNIEESGFSNDLYAKHEHHDGYLRDGCVFSEEIDAYDKMAATIKYESGVHVSYSCTTYSPYEGYRIAFNGKKGRLEAWIKERQPWDEAGEDVLRITDNFGKTELITIAHGGGGHGGGDTRLKDRIFKDPSIPDPLRQSAGSRDGAMSCLIGIAARESVKRGEVVKIASLTSLKPRVVRP